MTVRLLLFAGLQQAVGSPSIELDLAPNATYADLKEQLAAQHPAAAPLIRASRVAAEGEFAADTDPVASDTELALIPPVSGG